jgi:hypothetical protein
MKATRRDLRWLAVVIVVLLVVAVLVAPFIGRAAVRVVKDFFHTFLFPGGILFPPRN